VSCPTWMLVSDRVSDALDIFGDVHTGNGAADLLAAYGASEYSPSLAIASTLEHVLP